MKRETTNAIRYVLEELLPPVVRDSTPMRWLFRLHWGRLVDELEEFRANAHRISDAEDAQVRVPVIVSVDEDDVGFFLSISERCRHQ